MNRLQVIHGDITLQKVDAIVNAANSSLLGGGGVDGEIHRKGGKEILEECIKIRNKQGGCNTGEAVITKAGNLFSKFVIHTVGPVWNGGNNNEDELLLKCYLHSLELAIKNNIKTIAFPNISTGIYHFPKDRAAKIAIDTISNFDRLSLFDNIIFVCFDEDNFKLYRNLIH